MVIKGKSDVRGYPGKGLCRPSELWRVTTISFIFAKDMFAQKGYSSMYEANQINGVYFAGPAKTEGYIDDFGCWQTYTWTDYFERIFNTRNKDVKMRMYVAMQLAK